MSNPNDSDDNNSIFRSKSTSTSVTCRDDTNEPDKYLLCTKTVRTNINGKEKVEIFDEKREKTPYNQSMLDGIGSFWNYSNGLENNINEGLD